jgi:hypothetical protein
MNSESIITAPLLEYEGEPSMFFDDFKEEKSIIIDTRDYVNLSTYLKKHSTKRLRPLYILILITLSLSDMLTILEKNTKSDMENRYRLKQELVKRDYTLKIYMTSLNNNNIVKKLLAELDYVKGLYDKMIKKGYSYISIYDIFSKIESKKTYNNDLYDIFYRL